jgi:hypothetical protein
MKLASPSLGSPMSHMGSNSEILAGSRCFPVCPRKQTLRGAASTSGSYSQKQIEAIVVDLRKEWTSAFHVHSMPQAVAIYSSP